MAKPITVPDLDDPKEQEKLRRESSKQSENNKAQRKFELIEERLKVVKGSDVYGLMDARTMSLVPDLMLPLKDEMLIGSLVYVLPKDEMLIHCFQDSLIGFATRWYNPVELKPN